MKLEFVDIYDIDGNSLGICSKKEAHAKGLWHNLFHCWIRGKNGKVWLQERAIDKEPFAGMLSASVIGHIQSGENLYDGHREIKEELGIDIDSKKLQFIFKVPHELHLPNNKVQRHFNYVFLLETDKSIHDVKLQNEEVSAIYEADVLKLDALLNKKIDSLKINGISQDKNGNKTLISKDITSEDLCPFGDLYYNTSIYGMLKQDALKAYKQKSIIHNKIYE